MLTLNNAKKLLSAGDAVYVLSENGGAFQETIVLQIFANSLSTTAGNLPYEDHGWLYFLTKRGCKDYIAGGMK